ncbi:RES family NAD+ phosphorylase [Mesorhizobium sp. AR02]|uniref:RES family NAD+ phosphorylase n=1 Tax=Mesorhizobium sp. AR02 TaxID=2865837 RepID=UPI002B271726|nr:RES family NAD+ phosphorylase [Mesorhizobium sp. AR02]
MGFPAHQRCRRGDRWRSFEPARRRSTLSVPFRSRRRWRNTSRAPASSPGNPCRLQDRAFRWSPTFRRDPAIWDGSWREWDCAWRQVARIDRKIPSSWKLADLVITAGLGGILFPSLRHAGGTNLVIFPANFVKGDHVAVHEPDHRLPHDQSSWP